MGNTCNVCNAIVDCIVKINVWWANCLAAVASFSSRYPIRTIIIFFVLSLCCAAGVIRISIESRTIRIWVDQNSQPMLEREQYIALYDEESLFAFYQAVGKDDKPGNNILTKAVFDELFELHDELMRVRTTIGNRSFEDICLRTPSGACVASGALKFWNYDSNFYNATVRNDTDVQLFCAQPLFPDGTTPVFDEIFGEYKVENGLATARALSSNYVSAIAGASREIVEDWVDKFVQLHVFQFPATETEILGYSARALDQELERNVFNDIGLLALAYGLMIGFLSFSLGKPLSKLNGRVLISAANTVCLLVATGAAYGLLMWLGVTFTSLSQLGLFILLGIGIDNAYVIGAAFDATDESLPIETRVKHAMHTSGMSITATSLSDVAALFLGSLTKIPAIQFFCYYTGTAILFIYFQHVTVFVALLTLDTKRKQANRVDFAPCLHTSGQSQKEAKSGQVAAKMTLGEWFFYEKYGPLLLNNFVKAVVLLFFVAMAGLSGFAATQITTNFDIEDLAPDDSFVKRYILKNQEIYGDDFPFKPQSILVIRDIDYTDVANNVEITRLTEEMLRSEIVDNSSSLLNWHRDFHAYARSLKGSPFVNISDFSSDGFYYIGADFVDQLQGFLQISGLPELYQQDVVFTGNGSRILATRIQFAHERIIGSTNQVDALLELQSIYADSELQPKPFIFNAFFPFWDQFRIIVPECIQNLGLALTAIVVVATLMLINLGAVLIMGVVVASIFVWLLASLPFWGLDLDSISYVNLVMAVGLVVDYSLHLIHSFGLQEHSLTRKEKTLRALRAIGPAVFLGLFTTFLGVLPLAAASSQVFRVFFKMFLSIVVVGGIHGFVLLPVLLSLFGPSSSALVRIKEMSAEANRVSESEDSETMIELFREDSEHIVS